MSTINVLNMAGETVGTVELCDGILASSPIRPLCMKWSRTTWRIAVRARRAL